MIDIEKMETKCMKESDPSIIAFIIRSDVEIIAAGLDDLAWELSKSGYTTGADVLYLLALLRKYGNKK